MIVIECRNTAQARRVVAALDAMDEWIKREAETRRLECEFAEIDSLIVHDELSLTGCRRNAPEGS